MTTLMMPMIRNLSSALATLIVLFAPSRAPGSQPVSDRYRQQLQPVVERIIGEERLPGFSIGVVENNWIAYATGFGVRNLTRKDDPITTRSLFHMASITKPFVATSL